MRTIFFLFLFFHASQSLAINILCFAEHNAELNSDSAYLATGFLAKGGEITVKWRSCYIIDTCEFYFMSPLMHDTSVFLFHNKPSNFGEDTIVNLGSFKPGTPIIFKIVTTTNNSDFGSIALNKNVYSGQNRHDIDPYISEVIYSLGSNLVWRKHDDTVGVRFENLPVNVGFKAIGVEVNNVYIEGVEKYKVPFVHFGTIGQVFKDQMSTTLTVPKDGLYYKVDYVSHSVSTPYKTVISADTTKLKIYYTTDGSAPGISSNLYNGPITISRTTALKAIALIEGDTNWFPSEVITEKYIKEGDVSINGKDRNSVLKHCNFGNKENCYFDISGRKLNFKPNHKINGVYLLQFEKAGVCKRFVNTGVCN